MFSYKQPHKGNQFRWGVLCDSRDTVKKPLTWATVCSDYRRRDTLFRRTRNLETVHTRQGVKAFYKERKNWGIKIPFVGSLISRFI